MSFFYSSDNIEIIDRGLDIMVKEMKKKQRISSLSSQFSGGRHASQEPREYKVRIEQNQTHWIFTCWGNNVKLVMHQISVDKIENPCY